MPKHVPRCSISAAENCRRCLTRFQAALNSVRGQPFGIQSRAGDSQPCGQCSNKCNLEFAPRWGGTLPL